MRKYVLIFVLVIFLVSCFGKAFALMPPYSEKELKNESTHIISGKVLGVAYVSKEKDPKKDWEYSTYCAWFMVDKSYKGDLKKNDTILIKWVWRKGISKRVKGFVGGSYHDPAYYPQEVVKTHLIKYNEYYKSTWWNSKVDEKGAGRNIPSKLGQVVFCE